MTLLQKVEGHLAAQGIPATRFGRIAARDPRLILDMRRGRRPRQSVMRKIESALGATQ